MMPGVLWGQRAQRAQRAHRVRRGLPVAVRRVPLVPPLRFPAPRVRPVPLVFRSPALPVHRVALARRVPRAYKEMSAPRGQRGLKAMSELQGRRAILALPVLPVLHPQFPALPVRRALQAQPEATQPLAA